MFDYDHDSKKTVRKENQILVVNYSLKKCIINTKLWGTTVKRNKLNSNFKIGIKKTTKKSEIQIKNNKQKKCQK